MALDLSDTSLADLLAPVWFVLCWLGYTYYADTMPTASGRGAI